ncbi:MAG: low-specificity L-threonine aldolase [Acetobacteraceae bacterium]|nr:low-specificity L-threonine aldolase [Acetobacteraceae bacterium]
MGSGRLSPPLPVPKLFWQLWKGFIRGPGPGETAPRPGRRPRGREPLGFSTEGGRLCRRGPERFGRAGRRIEGAEEAFAVDGIIDLRSDTVTVPTPEMRRAMADAEVGDDVYGEDPTVNRLEELAASILGKEAGLLVVSGTMGNQVAVMTHCRRGDEILVEADAHIFYYEAGALAVLAGVQPRTVPGRAGVLEAEDVEAALRPPNLHFPPTSLLCLENTHNRAGGRVVPLEKLEAAAAVARRRGLRVHLDGARIFNAAVALGVPARRLAEAADSVMFCLSKGLSAPVGSLLVGSRDWIAEARRNRKIVGGGMRQAGVIAAAGIVALTRMVDRLAEDHENARILARNLAGIEGLGVDLASVETNMVMVDLIPPAPSGPEMVQRLGALGVKINAIGPRRLRAVTHKDVSRQDVIEAADRFVRALRGRC